MEGSANDVYCFSLCVWREARGEGEEGMRAVAHVIKNRVGAIGFPSTLRGVIYQKNAFTSMSVLGDPEYNLKPTPGDLQFAFCTAMVPKVLNGTDPDITGGAHYYENARTATSGWFARNIAGPEGAGTMGHPFTVQIGRQRFYI